AGRIPVSLLSLPSSTNGPDTRNYFYKHIPGISDITAAVANSTLALQASPLATVENLQGLSTTAERKRRPSRGQIFPPPGKPPRRPGHVSHKSASAIPTLSTINILPYAPKVGSPLVASPGSSPRTSASSRRPSAASAKSWVGRPATMANAGLHEQPHVNNAADLLRQAMLTNTGVTHGSRHLDDDGHDHIGSGASTPPTGTATPRPDLHNDKRFPGIINHYFGQSTPPQTPRSGSHESKRGENVAPAPAASTPVKSTRSSDSGSQPDVPVRQQKGQLEIHVEEGRGLRPSIQPYVVCVFQQNEDVSSGPKDDAMDTAVDDGQHDDDNLAKGVAMRRMGSGSGTPLAIPGMRSRQTSSTNIQQLRRGSMNPAQVTDPKWHHAATFDVVGEQNEIDVSVYENSVNETFIGHVRVPINLEAFEHQHEDWYKLQSIGGQDTHVTGEVRLKIAFHTTGKKTFGPEDFEILKLIGKGTFGQVFQVRKKDTKRIYAMKVLSKKVIVQKKEIQHTIGERNILVRTASTESPFIVGLKFSFQTAADLYLVTDYMSGGELFWHLQKEGRFLEDRAKFYIAELILALRHLHQYDIVYRDLKPENILLDANGHIALCDFGLSKANLAKNDTTNTFCGTTEYLAPEVLLDEQGYTKMVDFWSLGVLVFEMCCGWSPFYAEDTQQMYKNIAFGK
ncbi:Serine/threonine-protein kinase, partial [Oleoguttula sp. CCFEE 5521]